MNAIELLTRQHRELEACLQQVLQDGEAPAMLRRFTEAADQLAAHIASEEEVFYPAVKAARTEDTLLESLEEHLSLKRLMNDLLALQPQDATFEAKFKVLKEQAEHHHEEEEEHLFPTVQRLIDADALDALGRQMLAMQVGMHTQGEPREEVAAQTDRAAPL